MTHFLSALVLVYPLWIVLLEWRWELLKRRKPFVGNVCARREGSPTVVRRADWQQQLVACRLKLDFPKWMLWSGKVLLLIVSACLYSVGRPWILKCLREKSWLYIGNCRSEASIILASQPKRSWKTFLIQIPVEYLTMVTRQLASVRIRWNSLFKPLDWKWLWFHMDYWRVCCLVLAGEVLLTCAVLLDSHRIPVERARLLGTELHHSHGILCLLRMIWQLLLAVRSMPILVKNRHWVMFSPLTGVAEVVYPNDVPLAILAQQKRLKKVEGKKKAVDQCRLSREGKPNPTPRCCIDEGGGSLLKQCCREFLGRGSLQLVLKIQSTTETVFLHDLLADCFHESPRHLWT